jgi:IclR family pca regulon transcriptional regulator
MSITLNTGSRLPAYPTSMGRVLLAALAPAALEAYLARVHLAPLTPQTITDAAALRAELDRVRAQGWALVDGERERGVRSAAAPVRGGDGDVLAALNVSVNAARIDVADLADRVVPALVDTAAAISQDVAHVRT